MEQEPKIDWARLAPLLDPKLPKYVPHEPFLKQKLFLVTPAREVLFGGAAGGGKLICKDVAVATSSGFKRMGDIEAGDFVYTPEGKPTVVLATFDLDNAPAYRLTFDDGSTVVANDEHRWRTFTNADLQALTRLDPEWRAKRRAKRKSRVAGNRSPSQTAGITAENKRRAYKLKPPPEGQVRTTQEIVETLRTSRGRANHAIPVTQDLELPERVLPIDPYLFGVWLGDGTTKAAEVTTMDPEVIDAFVAEGYEVLSVRSNGDLASRYYLGGARCLRRELNDLGTLGTKSIPHDYLWGSAEQRLALLQGLMDTDGNVSGASVEFVNKRKWITDAVAHLARSLGHKVTIRTREAKIGKKSYGDVWVVKFAANRPVFRIPRKANDQSIASRRTNKFRYIVDAERVAPRDMRCLRVASPTHEFLCTEHLIPTHNSDALLMAALQHVHVPGYAALLFRKNLTDLTLPGALLDRAKEWLAPHSDVRWEGRTMTFHFPAGSSITFGYLDAPDSHLRYQGSEVQFVGFDEVTHIKESHYTYLFSRQRRPSTGPLSRVPIRMRAASNPAPNWVRDRFIAHPVDEDGNKRIYIPSGANDNPFLDQDEYAKTLAKLTPVERARLKDGDWWAEEAGAKFQREWFGNRIYRSELPEAAFRNIVRYWDIASTEPHAGNKDPDWTVGALVSLLDGYLFIHEIRRTRQNAGGVENFIYNTAHHDGPSVKIRMEKEPGASGKVTIDHYARHILLGFDFDGHPIARNKEARMDAWAGKASRGEIIIVEPEQGEYSWVQDFLDEAASIGALKNAHDDQMDAISGAFEVLTGVGGGRRGGAEWIV